MSKEKTKTFQCNILDYLEAHNNKTYKEARLALKELCLGGALKARKGQGVTFIVPAESVMADVMAKIYSDKESDIDFAVKTMQAHILNDEYTKVEELKSGDVSNRLNQKVDVESASGGTAKIKNGPELKVDGAFKMIPGRTGLSVMVATGKSMPLDGEAAPRRERSAMPRAPRPTMGRGDDDFNRDGCLTEVEKQYNPSAGVECYLHAVLAIMEHIGKDKKSPDYKRALVSLDKSPFTSLYLLIQTNDSKNKVISDSVLFGLKSLKCPNSSPIEAYKEYLSEGYALINQAAVGEIPEMRWDIYTNGMSKQSLGANIAKNYEECKLYTDPELKSFFANYKEQQDYVRFRINYIHNVFLQVATLSKPSITDFISIFMSIKVVLSSDEKYSTKKWGAILSQDDLIMGPLAFVYSGSFMYYPHVGTTGAAEDEADDLPRGAMEVAEMGTGQLPA
jgi:hypothetical protein